MEAAAAGAATVGDQAKHSQYGVNQTVPVRFADVAGAAVGTMDVLNRTHSVDMIARRVRGWLGAWDWHTIRGIRGDFADIPAPPLGP